MATQAHGQESGGTEDGLDATLSRRAYYDAQGMEVRDDGDLFGGGIDTAGFGGYGGRLHGDYGHPDYGEGEGEVYDDYEGAGYQGAAYGGADYGGYGGAPDFDRGSRYGEPAYGEPAYGYGEEIEEDYDPQGY